MSEKKLDFDNYVLDKNYKSEKMEYDEEVDGNFFPDREEHLKKKEAIRQEYQKIKNAMSQKRVRR